MKLLQIAKKKLLLDMILSTNACVVFYHRHNPGEFVILVELIHRIYERVEEVFTTFWIGKKEYPSLICKLSSSPHCILRYFKEFS